MDHQSTLRVAHNSEVPGFVDRVMAAEQVKWYRLAAEQGMAGSQFQLGVGLARECLQEMQDANRQLREE